MTTSILLVVYHILFNSPNTVTSPTEPQGEVQGQAISRDPALLTLDSILDNSGNIKPRSLTTSTILLSPIAPPTAVPGTMYFDAGSQSLKIYKNSQWTEVSKENIVTGTATIEKGQNQTSVNNPNIKATSIVTITFNSDYSPARKYWVTVGDGSFTVHTDLPLAQSSNLSFRFE